MDIERISQQPARLPDFGDSATQGAAVRHSDRVRSRGVWRSGLERGAPADSVELSERAQELARARAAVEAAPDVRADKVAQIRQQVEDGTYFVPADLLALKLLAGARHGG